MPNVDPDGRLQLAAVCALLSSVGITAYLLILLTMSRHAAHFAQHSFYVLLLHLAIGDLGILALQFVVTVPVTLLGEVYVGAFGRWFIWLTSLDTLFFYQLLWMNFAIAVNRLLCFTKPTLYRTLFKRSRIQYTAGLCWLLGLQWTLTSGMIGCVKTFSMTNFYFYYNCSEDRKLLQEVAYWINRVHQIGMPLCSFLMYLVLYCYLRVSRRHSLVSASQLRRRSSMRRKRQKRERSLLLQGAIICSVLLIEVLLFDLGGVLLSLGGVHGVILLNGAVIINSAVNPFIYLAFNSTMRSCAFKTVTTPPCGACCKRQ